jgi:hypothetical protein
MTGTKKKMHVSDEEVFYELLQENEYSGTSDSEYSSDSVSCDEEGNVSDNSSTRHGI